MGRLSVAQRPQGRPAARSDASEGRVSEDFARRRRAKNKGYLHPANHVQVAKLIAPSNGAAESTL